MTRSIALALVLAGCAGREERAPSETPVAAPGPAAVEVPTDTKIEAQGDAKVEASPPAPEPAKTPEGKPTVKQLPGGGCEPMPKVGDACTTGDGYCVLSWGSPGGWSSALWCREGRWHIEEEVNLP